MPLSTGDILTYNGTNWVNQPSVVGPFGIGGAQVSGQTLTLLPAAATDKGLVIKGAASQSANLQEWRNSAGNLVAAIDPNGQLLFERFGAVNLYASTENGPLRTDDTFQAASLLVEMASGQTGISLRTTSGGSNAPFVLWDDAHTPNTTIFRGAIRQQATTLNIGTFPSGESFQTYVAVAYGGSHDPNHGGRIGINQTTPTAALHITRPSGTTNPANPTLLKVVAVADNAMTAATEVTDVFFDLNRDLEFAAPGNFTNQRAVRIAAPNYKATGAVTITNASTFYINDAPGQGTNMTLSNKYSLFVDAGIARFDGDGTHVWELPADTTVPTTISGRIAIKVGGATKYIPYYN